MITHNRLALSLILSLVLLHAGMGTASAGLVELADPTITNSQAAQASRAVENVFDNVYNGVRFGAGYEYATENAVADAFIEFDFGSAVDIAGFDYAQRTWWTDSVTDFNLIFSTDATFGNGDDVTLPFEPTVFDGEFADDDGLSFGDPNEDLSTLERFTFTTTQTVRYVRWEVTSSDNIYDGAAEMAFLTTPEPSAFALFGIAGIAAAGYQWRRRRKKAS